MMVFGQSVSTLFPIESDMSASFSSIDIFIKAFVHSSLSCFEGVLSSELVLEASALSVQASIFSIMSHKVTKTSRQPWCKKSIEEALQLKFLELKFPKLQSISRNCKLKVK